MKIAANLALFALSFGAFAQEAKLAITINNDKVSTVEYYRKMEYLNGLGRNSRNGFVEILPALATIDAIITERIVVQLAREKNLVPTDAEIDTEIAYRLKRDPQMLENWKSIGRTDAEMKSRVKVELCEFRLLTQNVVVTEGEVKDLYELAKQARFTIPRKFRLRLISVRGEANRKLVDSELKAGKSFAALATLHSIDPSSAKLGGNYGLIPETLLSQQLSNAIGKLKKGESSEWLSAAEDVYSKFYVEDVVESSVIPLDETIKKTLKYEIMARKGSEKNNIGALVRESRRKANIKIENPVFDKAFKEFLKATEGSGN